MSIDAENELLEGGRTKDEGRGELITGNGQSMTGDCQLAR